MQVEAEARRQLAPKPFKKTTDGKKRLIVFGVFGSLGLEIGGLSNHDSGSAALIGLVIGLGIAAAVLPLDLASLASVREFVDLFRVGRLPPLAGLVCNAGLQNIGTPQRTVDGFETTFAVNHLGHFLLANLLLPDFLEDRLVLTYQRPRMRKRITVRIEESLEPVTDSVTDEFAVQGEAQ